MIRFSRAVRWALVAVCVLGVGLGSVSPPVGAVAPTTTISLTTFRDMLVVPSTGEVLVSGDDSVFVYSADGTYSATISDVFGAGGMDVQRGSVWVAETTAGKIAEINANTHAVLREISVGMPVTGRSLAVIGGAVWFNSNGNLDGSTRRPRR